MQTPSTSKMLLDLIPVLACFIAMSGGFILIDAYNQEIRNTFYGLSDHSEVLPHRAKVENNIVAMAAIPHAASQVTDADPNEAATQHESAEVQVTANVAPATPQPPFLKWAEVENNIVAMATFPQAASQDTNFATDNTALQHGSAEVQASVVPVTPPPAIADRRQNGEGSIKPKLFGADQSRPNMSIDPKLTRRSLTRALILPERSATATGQKRTKSPPSTARARATFSYFGRGRQFTKPRQHKHYVNARSPIYATTWNWPQPPAEPARLPGPNPRSPNGND